MKRPFNLGHRGLAHLAQATKQLRDSGMDDPDGKLSYCLVQLGKLEEEISTILANAEGIEATAMNAAHRRRFDDNPTPPPPASRPRRRS